ncbi:MAG: efflux RND transporter periplasmic adaptor subunit [Clostridium sp.]
MKKKKVLISMIVFGVSLIGVIILASKDKGSMSDSSKEEVAQYFQVSQDSSSKFKGTSVISDEQNIFINVDKGEISEVLVEDKQYVEEGTTLFVYYNAEVETELELLQRQINSLDSKIKKQHGELQGLSKEEQEEVAENYGIEEAKDSLEELIIRRDDLRGKVNTEVKAEVNGVVYINEKGKDDSSVAYMRVVSKEPLVVSEVSEFEVDDIKVDDTVELKVVSNGEKINGKIIEVGNLPVEGGENKSSAYRFEVKPEKKIRVGFTVEIAVNPEKIKIPKDYVLLEGDKTFVNLINEDGSSEKREIKATLDGENYILQDYSLNQGDKLLLISSDKAGGEK